MSYYPYFRGKQYELICLRENCDLIAANRFVPIIEPVKEDAKGLLRAISALSSAGASYFVVANPTVGAHTRSLPADFRDQVSNSILEAGFGNWIYQAGEPGDLYGLNEWIGKFPETGVLHSGKISAKDVLQSIAPETLGDRLHVFSERECTTRYRSAFSSLRKAILVPGFQKRKNSDYPEVELFSEVPVVFSEMGASGFSDYLIVGSEFSESGGAAYAVAIHITYAEPSEDGAIFVRHFVSDTNNSPLDPAGKFREAVAKLDAFCRSNESPIPETHALREFFRLHQSGHFPGLGYVKKLSMQHHLEMLAV